MAIKQLMMNPRLSVLMCVHNGEEFLVEAVKSVLDQTYKDFEFLVIDDCSTDKSADILSSFTDPRLRVIRNEQNLGLTKSLNKGLQLVKGEFVARMDADDICLPYRFEKQLDFFDKHPDIALCGSYISYIGDRGGEGRFPLGHEKIKMTALAYSPFAHPAVMWRRGVFESFQLTYDENFKTSQDFELWSRAVHKVKTDNIPEPLIYYREHFKQITNSKQTNQRKNASLIKLKQLVQLELAPSESEQIAHLCMFDGRFDEHEDSKVLKAADEWMYKIILANRKANIYKEELLLAFWKEKFFLGGLFKYDWAVWKVLKTSRCVQYCEVGANVKLKVFIKCLVKWKVKKG